MAGAGTATFALIGNLGCTSIGESDNLPMLEGTLWPKWTPLQPDYIIGVLSTEPCYGKGQGGLSFTMPLQSLGPGPNSSALLKEITPHRAPITSWGDASSPHLAILQIPGRLQKETTYEC